MANIARDNLDVIRIPRKVILSELCKKLGGTEPQYESWFEDGRYWCIARTGIATAEANTSSKVEHAMGCADARKEGAEEEAAIALIKVLKTTYRFEIDDMNLMKRARAEHANEQLMKQMHLCTLAQNRQREKTEELGKRSNELLDDMVFVQEACDEICGASLAALPTDFRAGPLTDIIYSVHCLNEWTDRRIYENIVKLNGVGKSDNEMLH